MRLRSCLALAMALAMSVARCSGQTSIATENQRQTALALEQQGKNAEAEAAWRSCLKAHPSDSEPYAHIGLLEARQEHYKEAIPVYRKAFALNPAFPGLRLNLGLALFKSGELKQAILEFKPLLKSARSASPEAQRLTILIGMAHYGLGEYGEAALYLRQAAERDAQNLQLRLTLAHSCLWSKQYKCVLDTYHEILALNAESAEADMLAGEALDGMKDYFGAIQQFRAAVKADPKAPDVHFELGYLLWIQKQNEEAASEFQVELATNPNHAQAMTYLADIDLQTQHPEAALTLLEKAIRIDPSIEQAHLDLGILYADAGRHEDALRELKEAEKQAPTDVDVHWRLGRLYRSMGNKDEAKTEFDQAKQINKTADSGLVNKLSGGHASPSQTNAPGATSTEK
jgi:tetratricopeptide (TPR) repeat protein